jgi:hypothetical protein
LQTFCHLPIDGIPPSATFIELPQLTQPSAIHSSVFSDLSQHLIAFRDRVIYLSRPSPILASTFLEFTLPSFCFLDVLICPISSISPSAITGLSRAPQSIPRCSLIFLDLSRLSHFRNSRDILDVRHSAGALLEKICPLTENVPFGGFRRRSRAKKMKTRWFWTITMIPVTSQNKPCKLSWKLSSGRVHVSV